MTKQGSTDGSKRGFSVRLSNGHTLVLSESSKISAEQLLALDSNTPERAFAEVATNPANPAVLGLKNLGPAAWSALTPAGEQRQIPSGKSIRIAPSTTINFGAITGTVRQAGDGVELDIANQRVPLRSGLKITARGLMGLRGSAPGVSAVEVVRNPSDPGALGLKNLSGSTWTASMSDGRRLQIDPGKSLRLAFGARVDFGGFSGSIEHSGTARALWPASAFQPGTRSVAIVALAGLVVIAAWYALRREQMTRSATAPNLTAVGGDVSTNLSTKPMGTAGTGGSAGERGDFPTDSEIAATVSQIEADPATQKLADEMADNLKRQMSEPIPAYLANLAPPPEAAH